MEIKGNLDNRLNSLITKLSPEESRRALRLFSKLSKITNFELEKLSEDSKTISSGLAQSVLYARGEKITSFKGLYAGAFITVKDGLAYFFKGENAGRGSSFKGENAGRESFFEGITAGYKSSFKGENAGRGSSFKGENAGRGSSFKGENAGVESSFKGENAGRGSSFEGKHAGGGVKYKGKITNKIILN